MTYLSSTDYVTAVQNPRALLDPGLRRATFASDPVFGIPMPASGNSAVVFKAAVDGQPQALRFFLRTDASSRDRYRRLHDFFLRQGLTDCVANAVWLDDAIVVQQVAQPVVKMEWVEGRALDAYVDHLVTAGNTAALASLADTWRVLVGRLQTAGFAHGDLQHGNVLVDTASRLRLVDLDGSWIDGFTDAPSTETGHPNFQLRTRAWGRWMDTFPGLLVYTALLALACRPQLWKEFSIGENLLFTRDDFVLPLTTPVWAALAALGDARVDRCLAVLREGCDPARPLLTSLASVIPADPAPVPPPPVVARVRRPYDPTIAWWDQLDEVAPATSTTGGTELPPPPPKTPYSPPPGPEFQISRAGQRTPPPPPAPHRRRRWGAVVLVSVLILLLIIVSVLADWAYRQNY